MPSLRSAVLSAVAAGAMALTGGAAAVAQNQPLELGQLNCSVVPGSRSNLIITSTALVDCAFRPTNGSETFYSGETGIGLGVDLSVKSDDRFSFLVLTARPTAPNYDNHPLAGRYYGAEATVSVGAGVGAKVLVGGSNKQFTLAPVGAQGTVGSGVSAGLGYLYLEPGR